MKCAKCKYAPQPDAEGYEDGCYHFEEDGCIWKDGSYGCTLNPMTLAAEERKYLNYIGEMGTAMGLEEDFRHKGISMEMTIDNCKHMIGYSKGSRVLHRNGKVYYKAYRNYWCNNGTKLNFDILCQPVYGYMEKSERKEYVYYYLTPAGLEWLGRKLGLQISLRD